MSIVTPVTIFLADGAPSPHTGTQAVVKLQDGHQDAVALGGVKGVAGMERCRNRSFSHPSTTSPTSPWKDEDKELSPPLYLG